MKNAVSSAFLGGALVLVLSSPSQALNVRTWISGSGTDQDGCGPITAPCRTLQYGHDQTSAGGEVDIKDSAGYGTLTITKSISIIAEGILTSLAVPDNGTGILVKAESTDKVVIRGITIDGHSIATHGIYFSTGMSLTVDNCHIRNVKSAGVAIEPVGAKNFNVSNTEISGAFYGILIQPFNTTPIGAITNVYLHDNNNGLLVLYNAPAVTRSVITANTVGLGTGSSANVLLGQSVVSSNISYGIQTQGGQVSSYGDNYINGNGTDISGTVVSIAKR